MKFPGISKWITLLFPAFVGCLFPSILRAGPPFLTDDPIPVEYRHWEVYLATQQYHFSGTWFGDGPHVEVNYGVIPDLQLHIIVPNAYFAPELGPKAMGLGDIELGAKYAFLKQTVNLPQIATFPLVELPTADQSRGLGSAHPQVYLPIWAQKDFGKWTVYGGGGYWFNPGTYNQNYGFGGVLLQRQITDNFAFGTEVYHQTSPIKGLESSTVINSGITYDLSDLSHILASVGHTVQGQSGFVGYFAVQFTFGPEDKKDK